MNLLQMQEEMASRDQTQYGTSQQGTESKIEFQWLNTIREAKKKWDRRLSMNFGIVIYPTLALKKSLTETQGIIPVESELPG
mmetsp:Transcript_7929/g.23401  ORF Transcript_7929/g.23401 Transcript_7929/m.23401 type:complete len:82 (+) Transcript_7929:1832-2077(+)